MILFQTRSHNSFPLLGKRAKKILANPRFLKLFQVITRRIRKTSYEKNCSFTGDEKNIKSSHIWLFLNIPIGQINLFLRVLRLSWEIRGFTIMCIIISTHATKTIVTQKTWVLTYYMASTDFFKLYLVEDYSNSDMKRQATSEQLPCIVSVIIHIPTGENYIKLSYSSLQSKLSYNSLRCMGRYEVST